MSKATSKKATAETAKVEAPAAIQPAAPVLKVVQNGVTPPHGETGICARIWLSIGAYRAAHDGALPTLAQVKAWGTANGVDLVTCAVQYYRYRKFAGIRGRSQATAPTLAPVTA